MRISMLVQKLQLFSMLSDGAMEVYKSKLTSRADMVPDP